MGCGEPGRAAPARGARSDARAVAPEALSVRQLPTGYDGDTSALAVMETAAPVVAHDSGAWAADWRRFGLTPPVPSVDFSREAGMLYGFRRASCGGFRAVVDSARLRSGDSVQVFVDQNHAAACSDTASFALVAAAVRQPRRGRRPAHVVILRDDRAHARLLREADGR